MKKVNAAFLEKNAINKNSLESVTGGVSGCSCVFQSKGSNKSTDSAANSILDTVALDVTPLPHNGCRPPKR